MNPEHFLAYLVIFLGSINLVRIGMLMVGSDLYGLQQEFKKKQKNNFVLPTFTVVIPAYNEEHTVIRSIESVLKALYPREKLDVIVVDDGSTDNTVALVKERLKNPLYERVRLLVEQSNVGKAHALNNAIKNYATGDLVMCLDADSTISPDALQNAARYFIDPRVVALSSNVKIRKTGTFLNRIQQFEYLVCYQMKRAHTFFNIEYIIGGIGSTFRHSALKKVNYYDTDTVTEDIDLTLKLIRTGNKDARVIYGSDVITYTESVLDIRGLIRQRFRWKHGRSQTFLKNLDLFFSTNARHNKLLTWVYLPFALFSDVAFFLEPIVIGYIVYIILYYYDWVTFVSALIVVSTYITLNVIAEDTIPLKQRLKLALAAPSMYFFFYVLSFVEYVALIKSYSKARSLIRGIGVDGCSWKPVERVETADAPSLELLASSGLRLAGVVVAFTIASISLFAFNYPSSTIAFLQDGAGVKALTRMETNNDAITKEREHDHEIVHIVQNGEYLRSIAQRYYGDETAWTRMYVGTNPDLIYPGDAIVIHGATRHTEE